MKWFKHFADALDDPFIQELIDEFGPSGYLAWFGLLEIIAKENGNKLTGKLDIKPQYLKRKLRISVKKLEQIYKFCSEEVQQNLNKTSTKPKLLFNFKKEKWNFDCPKLLELKDNYLKDLQASGKKPSKHKEEEVEAEKEEDKKQEEKSKVVVSKIKPSFDSEIKEIVEYLNLICKTSYRTSTEKTKSLIKTRLSEKWTVEQFKIVIRKKHNQWAGTKDEQYLRPETLFGNKFEGYYNQPEISAKQNQQSEPTSFERFKQRSSGKPPSQLYEEKLQREAEEQGQNLLNVELGENDWEQVNNECNKIHWKNS